MSDMSYSYDLEITDQFDPVPKAAPYVRMDKLLISVGYSQGIPYRCNI